MFLLTLNITIWLGNDFLEPNGTVIDINSKSPLLLLTEVSDEKIRLVKTNGGHFSIEMKDKTHNEKYFNDLEMTEDENIVGDEADAIMLCTLDSIDSIDDTETLHNIIGHENFVLLTLTEDEEKEIKKVHNLDIGRVEKYGKCLLKLED